MSQSLPTVMRAFVIPAGAAVPREAEHPVPAPGADEVLVRVRAGSIANADLSMSTVERVAGYEFAGEVAAVGENADAALIGTRVMGLVPGAFAEYVVAHRLHLLPVPEALDFAHASVLPMGLATEYGALRRGSLAAGDTVLITAATSGMGLLGIQSARALGAAAVIGTTRTEARRDVLLEAGADEVVITDDEDLAEAVHGITGGRGADLVLDHVAGGMLGQAVQAARPGGHVVSVGRLLGPAAEIDLFALAKRGVTLTSVSYGFTPPSAIGDLMAAVAVDLLPAVAEGRIAPPIDSIRPVSDVAAALDRVRSYENAGRMVVTVD